MTGDALRIIDAAGPPDPEFPLDPATRDLVDLSVAYLASPVALESLERDPYWPKWSSPWWHAVLLMELHQTERIPIDYARAMGRIVQAHYLPWFPFPPGELPAGVDPFRGILCHCALGTVYRLLGARGLDPDESLPGARGWFLRYQLPDGGLNCDEAVYSRPEPHSSMVSTVPALEAMLDAATRPLTPAEVQFLDRGIAYLTTRRLMRSLSRGGALMDPAWMDPIFPRYYEYDILRGLSLAARYSEVMGRPLSLPFIAEAVVTLAGADPTRASGPLRRDIWSKAKTFLPRSDGSWERGLPAPSFPLLTHAGATGRPAPVLTREWCETLARLKRLNATGLLRPS